MPYPTGVPRLTDSWAKLAIFLVVGYLAMGRSFAYLGLPWFSIYIGEIALAAFIAFGPRTKQRRWVAVAWRAKRLQRFKCLLVALVLDGAFEAARGAFKGYPAFTAVRDTAFNYYPIFLFLGIWVGLREKNFLRRGIHALAWWNGCYGLAYILLLSRISWVVPGTSSASSVVSLFGQPYGSAVALLGLIAFEPQLRQVWHLLALNAFVMLGLQIRAEWVGFFVGLAVFAWCSRRVKHLVIAGTLLISLVGFMYLSNLNLRSPKTRGGRISADDIVARAVAPVNKDAARALAPPQSVRQFSGTAEFRLVWWAAIWHTVHRGVISAVVGLGYGYPIGELNPFVPEGDFIQTPHNDFFYALAFSGWLGAILFALLQIELLRLLWRSYKFTGQPFGMMCWASLLAGSMFEDFFEAPMGAIPFFLLIGVAIAPALLVRRREVLSVTEDQCPSPQPAQT